jgi:uncharacterized Zn-binding protein involved in type VI secretion
MPNAARLFDLTNHPGVIASGSPTVLINNRPAARSTDKHTCAFPPVAGPHPPNAIGLGSKTVLINGLSAARAGDLCACGAAIEVGSVTVQIGG